MLPNGSRLSCSLRRPKTRIIAYRDAAAAAGWQLQALVRQQGYSIRRYTSSILTSPTFVPFWKIGMLPAW